MGTWRNTSLTIGLSALAVGQAFAQGMAPAPTMPPAATPVPVQVPVVTPSGSPSMPQSTGPIINRPRLEKPSRAGSVEMTWLGHAAWVLRSPGGTTVLIDPWLTNPRAPQDFVMPETIDAILVTHGHFDHLGQTAELAKKLHAPVIASYEVVEHLAHFGVTNGIHTNPGGTTRIKDLTIRAVDAVHSSSISMPMPPPHEATGDHAQCACHKNMPVEAIKATAVQAVKETVDKAISDKASAAKGKKPVGKKSKFDAGAAPGEGQNQNAPSGAAPHQCTCSHHEHDHEHGPGEAGDHDHGHGMPHPAMYGGAAMGFVIEMEGGPTVYHAGDTDVFGDMKLIAQRYHPDIALLPVGGVFSMDPKAAAMAVEFLGVKEVLPMHYGTMAQLTGTPAALQEAIAERKFKNKPRMVAPNPGERVTYIDKK